MAEEKSSLRWNKGLMSKKVPVKDRKKAWEQFITWLRNKNVVIVKDFDSDYEWIWLFVEESEKLHMKVNVEEHVVHRKVV